MQDRNVAVVIVAAGRGERAGVSHEGPKQYRLLAGRSVLAHTLSAMRGALGDAPTVVVIHRDDTSRFSESIGPVEKELITAVGGETRQQSVLAGLRALRSFAPEMVLVHDAARPFADARLIERVVRAVDATAGAIPAMPVADTLKKADGGLVAGTIDRSAIHAAQTPQGFPFDAILAAHEKAADAGRSDLTDDCAVAEWAGLPMRIVEGSPMNSKLTSARDIEAARKRLEGDRMTSDVRTGNGYDVHRIVPGDHVTLCGVRIANDQALDGHSDADVGLHALTDALLATCGAGDIGDHFPPSDPQWKGASSDRFLRHAAGLVHERGGRIRNADVTLICEAPKIAPHRLAMRQTIAGILEIDLERVSVKATTNETVGFIGRREGIAAIATASVAYPERAS